MRGTHKTRVCAIVAGALAVMAAACITTTGTTPEVGVIAGTISNSQGGGIANTTVTATSDSGGEYVSTTDSIGNYLITGVPDGNGSIGVGAVPVLCTQPGSTPYDVIAMDTTRISITVTCS
jgi:hypothetical protein